MQKTTDKTTGTHVAMKSLIQKLKAADSSFVASDHDLLGMRNFIKKVTHPEWKEVIEQSNDEVNVILQAVGV